MATLAQLQRRDGSGDIHSLGNSLSMQRLMPPANFRAECSSDILKRLSSPKPWEEINPCRIPILWQTVAIPCILITQSYVDRQQPLGLFLQITGPSGFLQMLSSDELPFQSPRTLLLGMYTDPIYRLYSYLG
jgi:hypothetical protein